MDNTSTPRIKQEESFGLAVRTVRSRLGLTQAEFAAKIGCNQNTVSRYEGGKQLPSGTAFAAVWNLADATARPLLVAYMKQSLSLLDSEDLRHFLQSEEDRANRAGHVPPSVFARMMRVCEKYKKEPDAAQLIDKAAAWLETEFEMRGSQRTAAKAVQSEKKKMA